MKATSPEEGFAGEHDVNEEIVPIANKITSQEKGRKVKKVMIPCQKDGKTGSKRVTKHSGNVTITFHAILCGGDAWKGIW